ncbi:IS110 family transposase (plasmid) [Azospirillum oryzae]|uniref:IS110 family transposase n=1 Tax=Azospirillum oryzae TaxID=286727 RepID=A0A6N1AHL4_9PROT|nr:IS110 family transposase [Azospirillum oryzae]KAA0587384.1 IS110 family transposase [Azospirillum oryzae]QKS50558.1 IS110 family transposase [Azospirillum oryzae]GLR79127.1 IS110 family transposase [Azospirillum oryzae]
MSIVTVGLDLAKHVFQVHGVDEVGKVVVRRQLRREQMEAFFRGLTPCLVGMEACATAHHWARLIRALGHEVRLIPPTRVKAYVQRGKKNDAADAAAIAEAVTRPQMAFVPIKSEDQQAVLVLHRSRDLLVRQRTMLLNALRAHLAEFGIVGAQGPRKLVELIDRLSDLPIPELVRLALGELVQQVESCSARIAALEKAILAWHRTTEASRNLATIPGIGPITASVLAATVTDPSAFKNGRHLAAWLGLVPRQNSSGGKDRLGGITKAGDRSIRRLLVMGATTVIRYARSKAPGEGEWLKGLLARKPARLASIALANKMARIAWAVLSRGDVYRKTVPVLAVT